MDVLQLDVSGRPQAWISTREAAVIYACDGVAWTLGDTFHVLRGGTQRVTGLDGKVRFPLRQLQGALEELLVVPKQPAATGGYYRYGA